MTGLPLGPGAEFDRIRAIARRLGPAARGLGDDAAVIPIGGTNLVVSIDASVEGVHFRRDWMTFEQIGYRAAAAALSDLAAEGASVIGVLVSIGAPAAPPRGPDPVTDIMAGVAQALLDVGGAVLGGDLVQSDRYIVDVCVLGRTDHPVTRAGARPGDGIWVTGKLGAPRAALEALERGGAPDERFHARFTNPDPRIHAGAWLAAHGAHAMIDVSDGLVADLAHLAAASGVAITIALETVPLWPGIDDAAAAVASGEEYELAVALASDFGPAEAKEFQATHLGLLTRIGEVTAGSGVRVFLNGRPVDVPAGFDHFR